MVFQDTGCHARKEVIPERKETKGKPYDYPSLLSLERFLSVVQERRNPIGVWIEDGAES